MPLEKNHDYLVRLSPATKILFLLDTLSYYFNAVTYYVSWNNLFNTLCCLKALPQTILKKHINKLH